jgi:hypothetical protein
LHVAFWFPSVVARWIAFPFDEVLQFPLASMATVLLDALNFKLLFAIN